MGCNNSQPQNKPKSEENSIKIKSTPKEQEKQKELEAKIVLLGNINVG